MKIKLLDYLACPVCASTLSLVEVAARSEGEIIEATLSCSPGGHRFPVSRGIPRFVPATTYADSFGLQWNRFATTQQDLLNRTGIFAGRWQRITGGGAELAAGKVVLDAGCGAGTFVGILAPAAGEIIAVDLSNAVDACYQLHGEKANVHVVQASIFELPLRPDTADLTYSIGVLQHTPDPLAAFRSLLGKTRRRGGCVFIWNYEPRWWQWLTPRAILRAVLSRLRPESVYEFLRIYVPIALGLRRLARKVPFVGGRLQKLVFICDYEEIYPELNEVQLYEWALLDTLDSLSSRYEIRLPDSAYVDVASASGFELFGKGLDHTGRALRFRAERSDRSLEAQ